MPIPPAARSIAIAACLVAFGVTPTNAGEAEDLFDRLDVNLDGEVTVDETPAEHQRLFERLLRRSDVNGNGALSQAEFREGLAPTAPAKPMVEATDGAYRGADATRLLLLKLDTNGDTVITKAEAPRELQRAFDQLVESADRNNDNRVNFGELSRAGGRLSRVANQVARRQGWDISEELAQVQAEQGANADRFERGFDPAKTFSSRTQSAALFSQLDGDGDGYLVKSELPPGVAERSERLFGRADRDRDGKVSEREFLAAAERLGQITRLQQRMMGNPSTEAMEATPSAARSQRASKAAARRTPQDDQASQSAQRLINRVDRNGDGAIARGEARGRLRENFQRLDTDGDGQLRGGELSRVVEALADRLRRADRASAERIE
ncbi:MAG: EF-hand domain-containing protein [Planctomycetota bacterium]